MLQNVLTLINRLCLSISLKFHQGNIFNYSRNQSMGTLKISADKEKKAPANGETRLKKKKKGLPYKEQGRGRKRFHK